MTVLVSAPRAYEANGAEVDASHFTQLACDPCRSVVVEACAGSGKTWLLVARMLRLLLAGAEPSELLAITFTRKAAQEMRERLMQLLHDLALQPDSQAAVLLVERGIAPAELPDIQPVARQLYERVLASPQSLSIDTFHSWFARLLQLAPLASGVPHGYALTESTGELMAEAYSRFMESLNDENHADVREALVALYEMAGDWNGRKLLDAFVDKRAEWWAATQRDDQAPLAWLRELCGEDGQRDARLALWQDEPLLARLRKIASVLGQGAKRNLERATEIESMLTAGPDVAGFVRLLAQFRDEKREPRGNDHRRGKLLAAVEQHFGGADAFEDEFNVVGAALLELQRRSHERHVLLLNEVLFVVGPAYLEQYQTVKAERRVFDFGDLEWHAYRLLSSPEHAAYLHSRLDARYRHILLDEFQDTNPLQWSIVRAWLAAYGDDGAAPSVFVVGDPKQSIYRFRRAEPRVFHAAREMLAGLGADVLRTNQTRRNAGAIVDLLNKSFHGNPIFSGQTTLAGRSGAVWRLPLIRSERAQKTTETALVLRDPLTTPRQEEEDMRRLEEGRAIARAIRHACSTLAADGEQERKWSDVMLLVKKRTHLGAYESALREAGIPFVSDKRGGLLQSLEVADLVALLTFLITPGDNRALAHVLKSPVFGASDDDLVLLAQRSEAGWWPRLQAAAVESGSPPLNRAAALLQEWLAAAPRLPVHDLLDRILHRGDLLARYAQAVPPPMRAQALGNIAAFTELALSLDSGRYPSLPKFIDALQRLRREAESDAPDEAAVDAAVDAVRILTIHGAKGLEASIVVLADANHSEPARDDCGILCDWPEHADAPTHFSCFGRQAERGAARDDLFDAEEAFRRQEDWNLLYVAATRAKELLIVSGVASARSSDTAGVVDGSWYQRLLIAPEAEPVHDEPGNGSDAGSDNEFILPIFQPPQLAVPGALPAAASTLAIEEGIVLHALLERLTQTPSWPVEVPDAATISRWLRCPLAMAVTVRERAECILAERRLERFFNPACFVFARNEMEVMTDGELLRFDRAVVFAEEVWVLDYKRDLLDSERTKYAAQLERYRRAALQVFPGKALRTALVTADGQLWEID